MLNQTNITAPRVPFIDERSGLISREWYRFFLNLFALTGGGRNDVSLLDLQLGPPTQPLLDLSKLDPEPAGYAAYAANSAQEAQLAELQKQVQGLQTQPIRNNVNLEHDVNGVLPVDLGGTGQSSYTNGQLLIGNSTGNTLTKAVLAAGANIGIANGAGSITISVSGASGTFITADTPAKTVTVTNGVITSIV